VNLRYIRCGAELGVGTRGGNKKRSEGQDDDQAGAFAASVDGRDETIKANHSS
jgi:hypothetical protein